MVVKFPKQRFYLGRLYLNTGLVPPTITIFIRPYFQLHRHINKAPTGFPIRASMYLSKVD